MWNTETAITWGVASILSIKEDKESEIKKSRDWERRKIELETKKEKDRERYF